MRPPCYLWKNSSLPPLCSDNISCIFKNILTNWLVVFSKSFCLFLLSSGQELVLVQSVSHTLSCTEQDSISMFYWHSRATILGPSRMGCGIGSCAKTIGAGHNGSTLYPDEEGGLNPANSPGRYMARCNVLDLILSLLSSPCHLQTAQYSQAGIHKLLRWWYAWKKRKRRPFRLKPRPTAGVKIVLQRVAKASQCWPMMQGFCFSGWI